jgi:hypothetical protein
VGAREGTQMDGPNRGRNALESRHHVRVGGGLPSRPPGEGLLSP